jgi:hypothetical protein
MNPRSPLTTPPRRRIRGSLAALTVVGVTVLSGCTTVRQISHGPDRGPNPEVELRAGATALEKGDFTEARKRLEALTAGCLVSPVERRAALLRASGELDPTNPDGVPTTAAALAAHVFVQSPTGDPDAALARSLYTLALDRGASLPAESSDPKCGRAAGGGSTLPVLPEPSTAARLSALGDSLTSRNDSVAALRARASVAEERARTLEQELERIRQLLRGGLDRRP